MSNTIIGGGLPIIDKNKPTIESQMAARLAAKTEALTSIMNNKPLMDIYSQLVVNIQHSVTNAFVTKYGSSSPRINDADIRNYSELILTDIFSKLPL